MPLSNFLFPFKVIAGIRETDEKFYYIVKEEKNYREALIHCRDRGGTLAMPKDEATNALIADYISNSGLFRAFIGLNDMEKEGQFVYADSSPLQNYSNWKEGEPHDPAGHKDCVEMLSTGEWNDSECQVTIYFVCEFLKKRKWKCLVPAVHTITPLHSPTVGRADNQGQGSIQPSPHWVKHEQLLLWQWP